MSALEIHLDAWTARRLLASIEEVEHRIEDELHTIRAELAKAQRDATTPLTVVSELLADEVMERALRDDVELLQRTLHGALYGRTT